jgi:iron-sulfur cluster repair protein YtfE (RIC family)
MNDITGLMSHDHRTCDILFAEAENAAAQCRWSAASEAFERFATAIEEHFRAEEETLFPRFEAATGMSSGPTAIMRAEHREMREQMAVMRDAIARGDDDEYAGESETLLILMQQHNMKEENILYPMCDARITDAEDTARELGNRLNGVTA